MYKYMTVKMDDSSIWKVPVDFIAQNRAQYYAHEFDNDVEKSLKEDTLPLFEADSYEVEDWAVGNMDWSDVADVSISVDNFAGDVNNNSVDYQDGWLNNKKGFEN